VEYNRFKVILIRDLSFSDTPIVGMLGGACKRFIFSGPEAQVVVMVVWDHVKPIAIGRCNCREVLTSPRSGLVYCVF